MAHNSRRGRYLTSARWECEQTAYLAEDVGFHLDGWETSTTVSDKEQLADGKICIFACFLTLCVYPSKNGKDATLDAEQDDMKGALSDKWVNIETGSGKGFGRVGFRAWIEH